MNFWNHDTFPDWRDDGKRAEVTYDDGRPNQIEMLYLEDCGFDGEDEYPIWVLIGDAEERIDFATCAAWRFVDE